ncbi:MULTISPECIES: COG2958 family protein [Methylobacter]
MSKYTQVQKVVNFLCAKPLNRFTAKEIANAIVEQYPEDFIEKRKNPRFTDDRAFLNQIVGEIGAQKDATLKANAHIFWQDKPRPRVYWYDPDATQSQKITNETSEDEEITDEEQDLIEIGALNNTALSEQQLYPLLVEYLKSDLSLFCQRIDEKRSKNQRGNGGNQWLHPDIVAMQPVDKSWNDLVRTCVSKSGGQSVRLWSFEVKKELNSSNVRKSFFQAVSNSSWANEGYLVATRLADSVVEHELKMLSALHGIGVILLNSENPSESDIWLPAIARPEIDWQSVNRIVEENEDFKNFIELVSTYYQTGRFRKQDWNDVH